MNQQRAKELLPLITAFAEGKTIQRKITGDGGYKWADDQQPSFLNMLEYRIKPEKKTGYINIYGHLTTGGLIFDNAFNADTGKLSSRIACIRIEYEEGQFDE